MSNDDAAREAALNYKRALKDACTYEPDLPTPEPRRPTSTGMTVADLERAFGVGRPSAPAAEQARRR